jgi:chaperone BCS1
MLASAVGSIPKRSIFLLEDIDCAFSRNEDLPGSDDFSSMQYSPPRSSVTLSGLLNVLDGVASQEGIVFFATVSLCHKVYSPAEVRFSDKPY